MPGADNPGNRRHSQSPHRHSRFHGNPDRQWTLDSHFRGNDGSRCYNPPRKKPPGPVKRGRAVLTAYLTGQWAGADRENYRRTRRVFSQVAVHWWVCMAR